MKVATLMTGNCLESLEDADSGSAGLGYGLRVCISTKLPGDAAGAWVVSEEPGSRALHECLDIS